MRRMTHTETLAAKSRSVGYGFEDNGGGMLNRMVSLWLHNPAGHTVWSSHVPACAAADQHTILLGPYKRKVRHSGQACQLQREHSTL